jgi:hypothetical protein
MIEIGGPGRIDVYYARIFTFLNGDVEMNADKALTEEKETHRQ